MDKKFELFSIKFAEILDIDKEELHEKFKLDSSVFDSLAILSMSALVIELFEVELSKEKIANCKNFSSLLKVIKNEINSKNADN